MRRDYGITTTLVEGLPSWSIAIFELLTHLGGLTVVLFAIGLLYLRAIYVGIRKKRRPLCPDNTAFIIAVVFGGLALIVLLKSLFALPRPPSSLYGIHHTGYGFPSGHTMAAMLIWGSIALWVDIGSRRSRFVIAGIIIAVVAISRLALGLHYSIDVVASVVFAGSYLLLATKTTRKRPEWMFAIATVISISSFIVTGGSGDSILAVVGTIGAFLGWRSMEFILPPIIRRFQVE